MTVTLDRFMTLLLTSCAKCESNYMLVDSVNGDATCMLCGHSINMTIDEIRMAEDRRDSLAESYIGPMEEAYNAGDVEGMERLATEVVEEGVSSWYAWFCIGWLHLQTSMAETAMDDFKMALEFLDEENFDEFYELVSEHIVEHMVVSVCDYGEPWCDRPFLLSMLSSAIDERFPGLAEQDLFTRVFSMIPEKMATADDSSCARMISDIFTTAVDSMFTTPHPDTYIRNLDCAVSVVRSVGEGIEGSGDGTIPPAACRIWTDEHAGLLETVRDAVATEVDGRDPEELDLFARHWLSTNMGDLTTKSVEMSNGNMGYLLSLGKNKGEKWKRDTALADLMDIYLDPLRTGEMSDGCEDMFTDGFTCPGCGTVMEESDEGLMVCPGCGRRSRCVTEAILDMPDDVDVLHRMFVESLDSDDAAYLNNLGEKLSEVEPEGWRGPMALARSCILDGEYGEALMLISECVRCPDISGDLDEVYRLTSLYVPVIISSAAFDEDMVIMLLVAPLLVSIMGCGLMESGPWPLDLLDALAGEDYRGTSCAVVALTISCSVFFLMSSEDRRMENQQMLASAICRLCAAIIGKAPSMDADPEFSCKAVADMASSMAESFGMVRDELGSFMESYNGDRVQRLDDHWGGRDEELVEMLRELLSVIDVGDDPRPMSNRSRNMRTKAVRKYLDRYLLS